MDDMIVLEEIASNLHTYHKYRQMKNVEKIKENLHDFGLVKNFL